MIMQNINWIAVVAAAVSTFLLGGLWYSPVMFGRVWASANKLTEVDLASGNMAKIFGFSFVFSFLMAANLAAFLSDSKTTTTWGGAAGFLAGFGWVALAIAVIALFERRSWTYILINGGYMTVSFVVMGLILGSWR